MIELLIKLLTSSSHISFYYELFNKVFIL